MKLTEKQKRPYYVNIPKNAEQKYFYGCFDIVKQTRVLWESIGHKVLRCSEPFTIKVSIRGKEKLIVSKS